MHFLEKYQLFAALSLATICKANIEICTSSLHRPLPPRQSDFHPHLRIQSVFFSYLLMCLMTILLSPQLKAVKKAQNGSIQLAGFDNSIKRPTAAMTVYNPRMPHASLCSCYGLWEISSVFPMWFVRVCEGLVKLAKKIGFFSILESLKQQGEVYFIIFKKK